jgi:hypothetical protein
LSGQETVKTGLFGDVPILILTHDTALDVAGGLSESLIQASEANHNGLLKLSERSRQITVKGSGNYIHLQSPDLVEREASKFVDRVRGVEPDPEPQYSVTEESLNDPRVSSEAASTVTCKPIVHPPPAKVEGSDGFASQACDILHCSGTLLIN